ncbi:MAG TPA: hypothetical protein VFJ66_05735 [Gaiellales bacterium]|nr:hypothetical protein [Gaiellales bacterium]
MTQPEGDPRFRLTIRRRVTEVDDVVDRLARVARSLREAGVRLYTISRSADDPSETEVALYFADRGAAEEMMGRLDSPESRERAMLTGALELGAMWLTETVVAADLG